MSRFQRLGIALVLSVVSATVGFGQPIPAPPAIPTAPMPAGVVPSDPAPVEAKKVPTLHNGLPLVPAPGDDELRRLLIARYNAALGESRSGSAAFGSGLSTFDKVSGSAERMSRAALELSDTPADKIAILERLVAFTKQNEAQIQRLYDLQTVGGESDKLYQATYWRLDAEIQLLRAKRKAGLAK